MKYIFDKIIILLLSLVTFGKIRSAEDILIALLFVILYISSNSFFETKRMSVISSIIYAFIMPIFPNMICFIPLVVIEAMLSKCWYILVFTALSGIYTFSELDSVALDVINPVLNNNASASASFLASVVKAAFIWAVVRVPVDLDKLIWDKIACCWAEVKPLVDNTSSACCKLKPFNAVT